MEDVRRYVTLVISFFEGTFLAGSAFGWPSLVFILQDYKLYENLCHTPASEAFVNRTVLPAIGNFSTNKTHDAVATLDGQPITGRCLEQKVALSDAYTAAITAYGLSALPTGLFFDRFGLRTTRTVIVLIGVAAQLQIAFANPGTEWLVFTGAVCLGISCYGLLMTVCHVALLCKAKASMVTGIFMAGIDTSFAYAAVKIAHDYGVSRLYSLVFLACLWVLVLISTWCLLPKFKVTYEPQCIIDQGQKSSDLGKYEEFDDAIKAKQENRGARPDKSVLWNIVISVDFVLFVFWFCSSHVRINMMNNSYDAWMTDIVDGDIQKVSYFTNLLAYGNFLAILPSPIIGLITDKMRARFGSEPGGTGLSLIPAVTLASTISILMTIFLFLHSEMAIYVSVVLFVLDKPLIYSTAGSYMGLLYSTQYFGVIYGITYMIGGSSAFIMHPYFAWIRASGSFLPVNCLILLTLVLSLSLPVKLYHIWRSHTHPEKQPLLTTSSNESNYN